MTSVSVASSLAIGMCFVIAVFYFEKLVYSTMRSRPPWAEYRKAAGRETIDPQRAIFSFERKNRNHKVFWQIRLKRRSKEFCRNADIIEMCSHKLFIKSKLP